jgi:hypothetical protein
MARRPTQNYATEPRKPAQPEDPEARAERLFDAAIHSLRLCVERTFAWEDKFKRLLLRFEFNNNAITV